MGRGFPRRLIHQARSYLDWYGAAWTGLWVADLLPSRISRWLDRRMYEIEERHGLAGPGALHGRFSSDDPAALTKVREYWDNYDWSYIGRDWTKGILRVRGVSPADWEHAFVDHFILSHISSRSVVLEIGPGEGRWSQHIQPVCQRLILLDVSQRALELCKQRFHLATNVDFVLSTAGTTSDITADSVDLVFAYGVFVDFDIAWTKRFVTDFPRLLRPGGRVVLHHSDFLPYADAASLEALAAESRMVVEEQNYRLTARPGEVITVL